MTKTLFLPWNHNCPQNQLKLKIYLFLPISSFSLKIGFLIRPHPRVLRVISKSLFLPWEPQFSTKWARTPKILFFFLYLYFLENRFFNQNHILGYFVLWLKHYFCPGNHNCPQNKPEHLSSNLLLLFSGRYPLNLQYF